MNQFFETTFYFFSVSVGFDFFQLRQLLFANHLVVYIQNLQRIFFFQSVLIDPYNNILSAVDSRLFSSGSFFNSQLWNTGFNGFGHSAQGFHFLNQLPSFFGNFIRKAFYIITASPRVYGFGNLGFFL